MSWTERNGTDESGGSLGEVRAERRLFASTIYAEEEGQRKLKVFLRMKPTRSVRKQGYEVVSDSDLIVRASDGIKNSKGKLYNFSRIFHEEECSQQDIFDEVIKDNVAKLFDGEDFTVLTYGASGSGKTYSLIGTEKEPGMIPRFLETLFRTVTIDRLPHYRPHNLGHLEKLNTAQGSHEIEEIKRILKALNKTDTTHKNPITTYNRMSVMIPDDQIWQSHKKFNKMFEIWVSFAEIYNEQIYDLLRADSNVPTQPPTRLRLLRTVQGLSYIRDLKWVYVRDSTEAFAALEYGRTRLRYAQTNVNNHSSRSHCLFTLKLVQYSPDLSETSINTFRLCDLAGSERAKQTGNEGARLNESKKINTSLLVLERCLACLKTQQSGQAAIPPYRESKLTSLLQNALSGLETISMLVTINPDTNHFTETQHVLNFSALAKQIINQPAQIKKSKSCIDFKSSTIEETDYSIDFNSSEVYFLRDEIDRMQSEFEAKLEEQEREIRTEITAKFRAMMKEKDDWFAERLEKERKTAAEICEWEKKRLQDRLTEEFSSIEEDYAAEINSLKSQLRAANAKIKNATENSMKDIKHCNDSSNDKSSEHYVDCSSIDEVMHQTLLLNINSTKVLDGVDVNHMNSLRESIIVRITNSPETITTCVSEEIVVGPPEPANEPEANKSVVIAENIESATFIVADEDNLEKPDTSEAADTIDKSSNRASNEASLMPDEANSIQVIVNETVCISKDESEASVGNTDQIEVDLNAICISEEITPTSPIKQAELNQPEDVLRVQFCTPEPQTRRSPNKENIPIFGTEKRPEGSQSAFGSRRKLFTPRFNNEMVAETKEPMKSMKYLNFEEDSPGAIVPPKPEKIQRPLAPENCTRVLRSQRKKQ